MLTTQNLINLDTCLYMMTALFHGKDLSEGNYSFYNILLNFVTGG